jgi:hypothetical protein
VAATFSFRSFPFFLSVAAFADQARLRTGSKLGGRLASGGRHGLPLFDGQLLDNSFGLNVVSLDFVPFTESLASFKAENSFSLRGSPSSELC